MLVEGEVVLTRKSGLLELLHTDAHIIVASKKKGCATLSLISTVIDSAFSRMKLCRDTY